MVGRHSRQGWPGPAGRAPEPAEARVSAALPEVGRRHGALGTRARGSWRSTRQCPAAGAAHRAAAGALGGGLVGGQRVSFGRRLALRPSIRRNRLCHSLWLTSASLPRRAAAIGRAALTSASSAGGFFKGEADRSARREPPPGLAQTALARTPTRNSSEPHSSGLLWKLYLGGAPRDSRAGACAPLRCCAPQRDLVCMHVPACACVCPRERGRVCEGAGVCAQMHCVRCASACVRPWVWRSWLWVARAHCHGQPGPAWQGSPAHMRTGISAGSCL